ncbi:MAG: ArsA-related P-loop ATPase [Actinomycetota bacterium]
MVAGKGGVGKTTLTAALARAAADAGRSVLVVSVDGRPGLGELLGGPSLDYEPVVLSPAREGRGEISGRIIRAEAALLDYLDDHGMRRVAKRFLATGAVDVLATTTPGIRDLLVLGKVRQLEQLGVADLIVVDAPAAGHAITFLHAARSISEVVSTGRVRHQADEVLALLGDPERCQVILATLPEETPVNEVVEVAYELEDRVGIKLGPVVVNGCWPDVFGPDLDVAGLVDSADGLDATSAANLTETADRVATKLAQQREQLDRLATALPLPQVLLPYVFTARLTTEHLDELAAAVRDSQVVAS